MARFLYNHSDTTQHFTTSNFTGPWYHAALLFSGLGSIVLFVLLFFQQIREDLVRAACCPQPLSVIIIVTIIVNTRKARNEFLICHEMLLHN